MYMLNDVQIARVAGAFSAIFDSGVLPTVTAVISDELLKGPNISDSFGVISDELLKGPAIIGYGPYGNIAKPILQVKPGDNGYFYPQIIPA